VTDQNAAAGGVETDSNDWRVTVRLHEGGQAAAAVGHLSGHRVEKEVQQQLGGRVVVGTDGGDELFLYTHARDAAVAAQQSVSALLTGQGIKADYATDRWHPVAEEWEPADVALPQSPAAVAAEQERLDAEETSESLAGGVALFEVRVQLHSHHDAVALAERLKSENYPVSAAGGSWSPGPTTLIRRRSSPPGSGRRRRPELSSRPRKSAPAAPTRRLRSRPAQACSRLPRSHSAGRRSWCSIHPRPAGSSGRVAPVKISAARR
jgi:hypothetical protein